MRSRLGHTEAKATHSKKKKRDREFSDRIILETIRQTLNRLQEIITFYQEQMDRLNEQIQKDQKQFDQLEFERLVLEGELEKFREAGLFDLDEYGRLKNTAAENIIHAYEQKTGITIDRSDPESYGEILRILMEIETEQQIFKDQIEKDQEQYEVFKAKRDEMIEIKEALESGDPSIQQTALLDAKNLSYHFAQKHRLDDKPIPITALQEDADIMGMKQIIQDTEGTTYDDFSFGFPPLQEEFSKMAEAIKTDLGNEVKNPAPQVQYFKMKL